MNTALCRVNEDPSAYQDIFPYIKLAEYLRQTTKRRKGNSDYKRLANLCCDETRCANFIVQIISKLNANYMRGTFAQEGIVELSKSAVRPDGTHCARPTLQVNSPDPKRITQINDPLRNPAAFINLANFNAQYLYHNPPLFLKPELTALLTT